MTEPIRGRVIPCYTCHAPIELIGGVPWYPLTVWGTPSDTRVTAHRPDCEYKGKSLPGFTPSQGTQPFAPHLVPPLMAGSGEVVSDPVAHEELDVRFHHRQDDQVPDAAHVAPDDDGVAGPIGPDHASNVLPFRRRSPQ